MSEPRPDHDLFVQGSHPLEFSDACRDAAERAAKEPVDASLEDLGLCVCVDAEATLDADDAFRLRWRSDGSVEVVLVATHPVGLIPLGSPVEEEARRRGASVYTPAGDVPMVPESLSNERLSLRRGERREAIVATGRYAEDGRLIAFDVRLGTVEVAANLTYDDAESRILADPSGAGDEADALVQWDAARHWTLARRRWRERRGAINSDFSSARARVGDGGELSIHRRQRDLWSHRLVAEINIAFNELVGLFCEREGVWCPWRVQEGADDLEQVQRWRRHPDEDLRRFMLSRVGRRTEPRFAAGTHDGLGVERYAQASSPLRRYADYLVHVAIRAFFLDESVPRDVLTRRFDEGEVAGARARGVMSRVQRYWLMRWFAERVGETFEAVFVEPGRNDRATVLLRETLTTVRVRWPEPVEVGAPVHVRIVRVELGTLRLEAECVDEAGRSLT